MISWCWALVTVLSGSCNPCRTSSTSAQHLTQERLHCLYHTSKWGWTHTSQIHSQKLFQSFVSAEPAEICGSCDTATMDRLIIPLFVGLVTALKRRGGSFTYCHAEHSRWLLLASTRLSSVCDAMCYYPEDGVVPHAPSCRMEVGQDTKGNLLLPKDHCGRDERLTTSSGTGGAAAPGSTRTCAGKEWAEKHWTWLYFNLGLSTTLCLSCAEHLIIMCSLGSSTGSGASWGAQVPHEKPQQEAVHGCCLKPSSLSQGCPGRTQHTGTIKGTHAVLDVKSSFSHSMPGSEHNSKPHPSACVLMQPHWSQGHPPACHHITSPQTTGWFAPVLLSFRSGSQGSGQVQLRSYSK